LRLIHAGADRDALDVIYDYRSYGVIKGGTWSSLPEQTSVTFRGRDLVLDRHFEIGFRCACRCRQAGAG
jgi:formylglycine-generating enzyme required for sulfatase activity